MSKSKTKKKKVSDVGYIDWSIKNYDKLKENTRRMQACWNEIQRLKEEIDSMDFPIEYQLSWKEK